MPVLASLLFLHVMPKGPAAEKTVSRVEGKLDRRASPSDCAFCTASTQRDSPRLRIASAISSTRISPRSYFELKCFTARFVLMPLRRTDHPLKADCIRSAAYSPCDSSRSSRTCAQRPTSSWNGSRPKRRHSTAPTASTEALRLPPLSNASSPKWSPAW